MTSYPPGALPPSQFVQQQQQAPGVAMTSHPPGALPPPQFVQQPYQQGVQMQGVSVVNVPPPPPVPVAQPMGTELDRQSMDVTLIAGQPLGFTNDINTNAIQSVDPGSQAERAGIQVREFS